MLVYGTRAIFAIGTAVNSDVDLILGNGDPRRAFEMLTHSWFPCRLETTIALAKTKTISTVPTFATIFVTLQKSNESLD